MRWLAIVVAMAAVYPQAASAEESKQHLVYGEVLGKAGLYGLGYEHTLNGRLSLGGAVSYAMLNDQQVATIAPYLHVRIFGHRNSFFGEVGGVFARSHLPSPVMGWDGMTESGVGALTSLGWERRTEHLVLRASASLVMGTGGIAPMLGFMIGVPL
jgi:hypothetical protein